MKLEQIAQEIRLSEWAKDIKECKAAGMTVKEWCVFKGISINTYRYQGLEDCRRTNRGVKDMQCETAPVSFVPVSPSVQRATEAVPPALHEYIRLIAGGKTLELPQTIPLEYFKTALEMFAGA